MMMPWPYVKKMPQCAPGRSVGDAVARRLLHALFLAMSRKLFGGVRPITASATGVKPAPVTRATRSAGFGHVFLAIALAFGGKKGLQNHQMAIRLEGGADFAQNRSEFRQDVPDDLGHADCVQTRRQPYVGLAHIGDRKCDFWVLPLVPLRLRFGDGFGRDIPGRHPANRGYFPAKAGTQCAETASDIQQHAAGRHDAAHARNKQIIVKTARMAVAAPRIGMVLIHFLGRHQPVGHP